MIAPTSPPTALLFAGQGTQYVGMGRILRDRFPEARDVFEQADAALGEPLSRLIFEGPEDQLTLTANTQPAVLTVAVAGWAVLRARGFVPSAVAGHSLGEFGALVASGALDFSDAIRLCRRRGELMQRAVDPGVGAMSAIGGLGPVEITPVVESVSGIVGIAADNAPGLVVISGAAEAVAEANDRLERLSARVTPLPVSAPFHSPYLAPAAAGLGEALDAITLRPLQVPYVDNVSATWTTEITPEALKARLVAQITAPVRWRESLQQLFDHGIERFWHLGPGRSNLSHVKRIKRRTPVASLDTTADLDGILNLLGSPST
ncbi:MAG: ACP S-malonyltransferase [Bradymonadia bacterium]